MSSTAFCFDLDGTVTTTEILPCIASELGIADEMAVLTRFTMDGHIPFASSFKLRCLLLGQIPIERVRNIVAQVPLDPKIVEFIQSHSKDCYIVTGNLDIWIEPLIKILGCQFYSSKGVFQDGMLRVANLINKADVIPLLKEQGYEKVVAIGDGANDAAMLAQADVGIAYAGVHAPANTALTSSNVLVYESSVLCHLLKML